jgi:antitoxin component YwqK of YwqJK toxin-antitoxin module
VKAEETFMKGMRNGPSKTYFPNGKVESAGLYRNEKQHGKWNYFDEKGKLTKTINFKYGVQQN